MGQGRMVVGETPVVDEDCSESVVRTVAAGGAALRVAVAGLQRELAAFQPALPDRAIAEDVLAELLRQTAGRPASPEQLRYALLLVAAALGSVSALAAPLAALREAVENELS